MLPDHATPASVTRYEMAQQIASVCPPELAEAIAVCGSTARGWSDDASDMEMNFWVETLPPLEDRVSWMEAIGVARLEMDASPHWDGSQWISGVIVGQGGAIEVELGWQTFGDLAQAVARLLSGGLTERAFTFLGDLLIHALPLRPAPALEVLIDRLRAYPDAVQTAQAAVALQRFGRGHAAGLRRLAARGETISLNERLNGDLEAAISLLYAAHRRWMPSRKWTMTVARAFAPGDWLLRCDAALTVIDPSARIDAVLSLVREAVSALPAHIDTRSAAGLGV